MTKLGNARVSRRLRIKADVALRVKVPRLLAIVFSVVLTAGLLPELQTAAEVVDSHVTVFEANPSYINLNFTTAITVTIGTSYGPLMDNYTATITKPSGSTSTAWFNFSAIESKTVEYGNATFGFMTTVDEVGSYSLRLDYFNGTAYSPAAYATLLVTDELIVVTEPATASNEYTDVHNCPIAQEFQRGGEIIGRAYVTYASNLEFVNGTKNPDSKGKITGTVFGVTKPLIWQNIYHFWRAAYFPEWNTTTGVFLFTVAASDGKGNSGSGISPAFGLTAWKVVPAILKVVPRVLNASGAETVNFRPGETVTLEATVTYEGHKAHNKAFPGPLNNTRGGSVVATLGMGTFNTASGVYEDFLTNITLTLNPATQKWFGTYTIPATQANVSDVQARISANDSTNPPNSGGAFSTRFAIKSPPAPQIIEVPHDIYRNTTVTKSTGFDLPLVGSIAVALLIVGVGVGYAVSRIRKGKDEPMTERSAKKDGEE